MTAGPPPRPAVDLSNCDREPIHIPGAVQPHGVLLALTEPDFRVAQASANAGERLGLALDGVLGCEVRALLGESGARALREALAKDDPREASPIAIAAPHARGTPFDGIVHRSGGLVLLELEPAPDPRPSQTGSDPLARRAVSRLQGSRRVVELCALTASEVRAMTGFDRVMVYRFDADGHGHVIAEAKRDEVESFLDLRYPASDIPAQARRLYETNWLRLIVDVGYRPTPIVPVCNPLTGEPLDLSHSVLRSVSPIHVEYLRNMGVRASLSISLLRDGALWGLVICHHGAPRFVPYEVRRAAEFLGRVLSWQVDTCERAERYERRAEAEVVRARLVEQMAGGDLVAGLTALETTLLDLVDARGAAIRYEGTTTLVGATPPRDDIEALARVVRERANDAPYVTDALSHELPDAAPYVAVASGLLALPLSRFSQDIVMWFRPEVVRTVEWAGDPNKVASLADGAARLSPRGSFALWKETLRGRSLPWEAWQVEAASELRNAIVAAALRRSEEHARVNSELRALTDELRAAAHAKDEFLATISHELRTPLNAMLGWLRMLRGGHLPVERHEEALGVIERNAKAQAQLVEDLLDVSRIISGNLRLDVRAVELARVIESALDACRLAAEARSIRLHVVLDPAAGSVSGDEARLQQVVWNLVANAVKFTPKGGRVRVQVERVDSYVELTVADNGEGIEAGFLPHVFERFRQAEGGFRRPYGGLGLGLAIVRHLVELHGGTVRAFSDGKGRGSTFVVRLPMTPVRPSGDLVARPRPGSVACPPLAGTRVLVVDDERDAAELLVVVLSHCGVEVRAAASAAEALALLPTFKPDAIVSDVGMPGTDGFEFLRAVRALPAEEGGRTPAVAVTAYARTEDRAEAFLVGFQAHIPKPIEPAELLAVLANLTGRVSGR